MTDQSFAYRLFQAIRVNKKKLLEARPTLQMYADNYKQCKALQSLIDAMFAFERFARGSQKALAGSYEVSNFTRHAKSRDRKSYPDYLNFLNSAEVLANRVVWHMLECQSMLVGAFWQQMTSIEGLHNVGFRRVAHWHILHRLPGLVSELRERSAEGFSASFTSDFILEMTFVNGAAKNEQEQPFPTLDVEGKTLEQQIVLMNRYWTEIKHCVREAAKSPANWPTLLDSRNVELENVNYLLTQFFRGLRPEQKALLRKYPQAVNQFFSHTM